MGCCTSRPRDDSGDAVTRQPQAVQDMINASNLPHPPPVFREAARPASSSNSVATSTEHHPVALNEHYNEPLKQHTWRTKANKRPWTRAKWLSMREEFFHTRVTNRPEIWGSLKAVVELLDQGEVETAQGILNASDITLPTGDLVDGAYDSLGNLYQLPPYVVSAPENMVEDDEAAAAVARERRQSRTKAEGGDGGMYKTLDPAAPSAARSEKQEKEKNVAKQQELLQVKARLSDRAGSDQDVVVKIGKFDNVKAVIEGVAEKAGVPPEKVKIAYMGKVMKPNKGFVAQGWQLGHVVNALILP